jgi:hypothetical protein
MIGLSMSPPNDLIRLGYPKREFERLVFELVLRIVRAGGRVCYGGHLRPESLLVEIVDHLAGAYASESAPALTAKPLLHLLPLSELRKTPFDRLASLLVQFRPFAETRVPLSATDHLHLNVGRALAEGGAGEEIAVVRLQHGDNGKSITLRNQNELDEHLAAFASVADAEALRIMREAVALVVDVRIVFGGKRGDLGVADGADAFGGNMPGIYEEALIALDTGRAVLCLAAFGGAARDAAADLGLIEEGQVVPMIGESQAGVDEAHRQMRERRSAIADGHRDKLREFATRNDTELLARDLVAWIGQQAVGEK